MNRNNKSKPCNVNKAIISMEKPNIKPASLDKTKQLPKEIGGRKEGLEPTRYGDWEYKGRCIDF